MESSKELTESNKMMSKQLEAMLAKLHARAMFDYKFTMYIRAIVEIGEIEAGVVTEDSIKFDGVGLKMNHYEKMTERDGHCAIDVVGGETETDEQNYGIEEEVNRDCEIASFTKVHKFFAKIGKFVDSQIEEVFDETPINRVVESEFRNIGEGFPVIRMPENGEPKLGFPHDIREEEKEITTLLIQNIVNGVGKTSPGSFGDYNKVVGSPKRGDVPPHELPYDTKKRVGEERVRKHDGKRSDGRTPSGIRLINSRCGLLPRAHGSALFTRGETQALAVATLGDKQMAQRIDNLVDVDELKRFYLQYSFPPSCVGEVRRVGAPSRREVGHGMLAERALEPILPSEDDFPYIIRIESNITESNGSSSMASVCGGCLALQDAGVPIKSSIAGIAMGMVLDTQEFGGDGTALILSDITGSEDASGDMDFKVAGNEDGITAFQMDIKSGKLLFELMHIEHIGIHNSTTGGRSHSTHHERSPSSSKRRTKAYTW
ncbi:hypothetical protein GIB67_010035 [Kingdonia uniflora]|uniref:Exoribonuclease phosphorolytic domain-containing protein n=1 Tax=Kingdonia uniflora TaxID=39325 RepID=A0A7J7KV55_9MAGN|nr:hypothetical protein GIB67_010035 [Kingdonia uniflora]